MEMQSLATKWKSWVYKRMAKFSLQDTSNPQEMAEDFESITDLEWSYFSSLSFQFSWHAKKIISKKVKFMPKLIEPVIQFQMHNISFFSFRGWKSKIKPATYSPSCSSIFKNQKESERDWTGKEQFIGSQNGLD